LYQTEGKVKQIPGIHEEHDIDLIQEEMKDMKEAVVQFQHNYSMTRLNILPRDKGTKIANILKKNGIRVISKDRTGIVVDSPLAKGAAVKSITKLLKDAKIHIDEFAITIRQTRAERLLARIRGIVEAKKVTFLLAQGSVEGTYLIQIPAGGPKDQVKDVEASITNDPNYSLLDTSGVKVNGKSHMQVRIRSKRRSTLAGVAINIRPSMTDIDGVKTLVSVEK